MNSPKKKLQQGPWFGQIYKKSVEQKSGQKHLYSVVFGISVDVFVISELSADHGQSIFHKSSESKKIAVKSK